MWMGVHAFVYGCVYGWVCACMYKCVCVSCIWWWRLLVGVGIFPKSLHLSWFDWGGVGRVGKGEESVVLS